MSRKIAALTIQKWGNSLAVRLPAALARNANFQLGTLVELDSSDDGIVTIKATGHRKLSLKERLAAFDPKKHGGEAMQIKPIGREKI